MPKDKRLLITKAVLHQVSKVAGDKADGIAIELTFVVPVTLATDEALSLLKHRFLLPHHTYARTGRVVAAILPTALVADANKVNSRHKLVDAIVPSDAICAAGGNDVARKAFHVAQSFQWFIADERVMSSLPPVFKRTAADKPIVVIRAVEPGRDLVHELSLSARCCMVRSDQAGRLRIRLGHGGMTAGDVHTNAREFISAFKSSYPHVYRHVTEFKLESEVTAPIRYMEAHIAKQ